MRETFPVVRREVPFIGDPAAPRKPVHQKKAVLDRSIARCDPQRQTVGNAAGQVASAERIFPLVGAPPSQADDGRQVAVAGPVLCQQYQLHAIRDDQFGPDQQFEAEQFGRFVRTHDSGKGTFVGNRQRAIAQFGGTLHQFARMRRSPQKTEVAQAVQFCIVRQGIFFIHAKNPCRNHRPGAWHSR